MSGLHFDKTAWKTYLFDDIASSISDRVDDPRFSGVDRYVGLEHLDPQSIKIRKWGAPDDVSATKLRFYPGDVIYGRRRAYQRKLGVADFEGICSAHALVLRAKEDVCLAKFLPYFLQTDLFHQKAVDISVGSLSPTINWKTLARQTFFLPSLKDQEKIIEIISSIDRTIEAYQDLPLETQRESMLHELLSAGGEEWTETTLGEIIVLEYGKPLKAENRDGKGFPVFGSAGKVGLHSEPLVNESPVIVVGRKGTAGAVWWSDLPCSVIDTAYYVGQKVETDMRFLYFILGFLDLPSLNAQTGVPGLNRDRAYSSQILLPPLAEQKRIVEIVSSMDEVIRATKQAIQDLKALRRSLLTEILSVNDNG